MILYPNMSSNSELSMHSSIMPDLEFSNPCSNSRKRNSNRFWQQTCEAYFFSVALRLKKCGKEKPERSSRSIRFPENMALKAAQRIALQNLQCADLCNVCSLKPAPIISDLFLSFRGPYIPIFIQAPNIL